MGANALLSLFTNIENFFFGSFELPGYTPDMVAESHHFREIAAICGGHHN